MNIEDLVLSYDFEREAFKVQGPDGEKPIAAETAAALAQLQSLEMIRRVAKTMERLGFALD
ncbi:hypothetical protein [Minwuia thermotolerans]|nr:hypothetical protein [Minwuia thermotolerans]